MQPPFELPLGELWMTYKHQSWHPQYKVPPQQQELKYRKENGPPESPCQTLRELEAEFESCFLCVLVTWMDTCQKCLPVSQFAHHHCWRTVKLSLQSDSIKLKKAQRTDEQILKFRLLMLFISFVCELLKSSEFCRTVINMVSSVRKQFFILDKKITNKEVTQWLKYWLRISTPSSTSSWS